MQAGKGAFGNYKSQEQRSEEYADRHVPVVPASLDETVPSSMKPDPKDVRKLDPEDVETID
jgi:hypothetical protein